jgi:repressor LexA
MSSKKTKGKKEPTDKQVRLYNFIQRYEGEHGYAPSYREMQNQVGFSSTSVVNYNLAKLETLSLIERDPNVARGLRVIKPLRERFQEAAQTVQHTIQEMLSIPIIGRVVAGKPVPVPASDFSYFDADYAVDVAYSMLSLRGDALERLYALEVKGDSMVEDLVNDGDIVVLQPVQDAENGEMVAVWLPDEDETTLKRFYREDKRIRLQPANPKMDPIYISDERSMEIQGKVLLIITPMKSM